MPDSTLQRLREMGEQLIDPELTVELFMPLFEMSPDAVIVVNATGMIVLMNRQAELLFGYHRSELLDGPIERLVPESVRDKHQSHREHFAQAPSTRPMGVALDLKARRKDGAELPVKINLSPVVTRHGTFTIATIRRNA